MTSVHPLLLSSYPGLVQPKYLSLPDGFDPDRTLGPEIAAVNTLAGFPPDPEQRLILDVANAFDKKGKSVAFTVVVIAPRQNLKTGAFKQQQLGDLYVRDERLTVWSAHEFDTSQEALNDLEALIDGSDRLRRKTKRILHGAVPEIITTTGARAKFKTRTKGAGRGLSGRRVKLDEGFAIQPGQVGALMPIMMAQPDPQVWIGSSACRPESAVLWDLVQRGRAGTDPRMFYIEWCAPEPDEACADGEKCDHARGREGCGCDNLDLLRGVHSAITRGRILIQTLVDMRSTLPPEEYGREIMGWHDEPVEGVSPFKPGEWDACEDPTSEIASRVAVSFDVRPDLASAVIAAAGRRADDISHGELVPWQRGGEEFAGSGTAWLLDRLVEVYDGNDACVLVLDPSSPAGAFEKDLLERDFVKVPVGEQVPAGKRRLHLITAREKAQACGALAIDVREQEFRHLGQQPLNDSAEGVRKKALMDAFKWDPTNSTSWIGPIEALTLARHGFATYGLDEPAFFAAWR